MTDDPRWDAVEEAVELQHEGLYDEAIPVLRAALERDPGNVLAHYQLGRCLHAKEQYGPALAAFTEAERREETYLGAVVMKGVCLFELARFDEAARAGRRALELRDGDPDALRLLGFTYAELGQRRDAMECLERFLTTNPTAEERFDAEALLTALRGKSRPLEPV